MKRVGYALFALCALALCALALTPASLLLPALAGRVPELQTDGAIDGTLLAGSARRLRYLGREFGEVRWRFQPGALLSAGLAYRLWLDEPDEGTELSAVLALRWQHQELSELRGELRLPRALRLAGMAPPPINARLRLDIDALRFSGRRPLGASGRILAAGVHTAFGRTLELGDYRLDVSGRQGAIRGLLSDAGGPIELGGELSLQPSGRYRLDAELRPRSDADPALTYLLGLLGPAGPDRRWQLQLDGQLRL